jgi:hypothetical protein
MEFLHSAFLALGAPFLGGMFSEELDIEMVGFTRMFVLSALSAFNPSSELMKRRSSKFRCAWKENGCRGKSNTGEIDMI